ISTATRAAICSLVKRRATSRSTGALGAPIRTEDPLHEDAGRHDHLRIEGTQPDEPAHFDDGAARGRSHDRPEVPRGLAINEVPPAVRTVRFDERYVRV